ncbi:GIY-YIG nuclease family protein [Variovorax sp. LjRoot178]|uniref:GIY-YIG nuclease family protein n=1 Tax=Variovorax sp. LjRoot178 TaxID=3342277 RepID=UPI003ECF62C4
MTCATHIAPGSWCLYLLECRGGVMYAGITNKLAERFAAHQAGKGAKFTRANPPVRILGARPYADRSEASKAECVIKKLPRGRKLAFLSAA